MISQIKIDITKLSKRWDFLQRMTILVMFGALHVIAAIFVDLAKYATIGNKDYGDAGSVVLAAVSFVIAVYVLRTTWICSAAIDEASLTRLRRMYRRLMWAYLTLVAFFALMVLVASQDPSEEATKSIPVALMLIVVLFAMIVIFIFCLRQIKVFLSGNVKDCGISLSALHESAKNSLSPAPAEANWIVRLDQPTGFVWVAGGAILILIGAGIYDYYVSTAFDRIANDPAGKAPAHFDRIGMLIEVLGAYCIYRGRSFFLPRAEAILAIDKRSPILYLRSFLDDKPNMSEMMGGGQFFDRSTEMKLSKYFNLFGQFVAIGSPQDKVPRLGAMRLLRSDDEWQGEVVSLMGNSKAIVACVGTTGWIKWELAEINNRNFTGKTLFLFPVTIQFGFWLASKRLRQQAQRIDVLKQILPQELQPQETKLNKKELLLAYVVRQNATVMVTSKRVTSNAQFLSAIIAHYIAKSSGPENIEDLGTPADARAAVPDAPPQTILLSQDA